MTGPRALLTMVAACCALSLAQPAAARDGGDGLADEGELRLAAARVLQQDDGYAVTHGTTSVLFMDILDWAVYSRGEAPHLVGLRIVTDGLPGDMPRGLAAVLRRYLAAPAMADVEAAYRTLEEGDVIVVHDDGSGAAVSLNGRLVARSRSPELVGEIALCVKNPGRLTAATEETAMNMTADGGAVR